MPRLNAGTRHRVSFTLNGLPVEAECEPRTLMHDFLRHQLAATGTHAGCEHGVCGACTVQVDGAMASAPTYARSRGSPRRRAGCPCCRSASASTTGCSAGTARPAS